ncbi:MAG: methyltransferase domain-containing protein [Porticoccaceae bacterium]|nr:methyltransferase domain-containing protein [Pseudomonadales bacterium]MCP5172999.1 methyltransferase domain-containing protein [Pseudomonadales bacterium]MCP5302472.1 methyltransferase domain-containing protein [Pseudomonadales bacterium]
MKHEIVQDYYGKALQGSEDLKTDACCTVDSIPEYIKPIMAKIHPEVSGKYYGCGLVAPPLLDGTRILDLGSGSGQDCYVLSAMAGENGAVVGVDMTDEQLEVANRHLEYHRDAFGYERNNVRFLKGYIEKLDELDLADESFDIIVSNCVINLSPDKQAVLEQAYRLLKPGGEMYFSDVYADRRVPAELVDDPLLYGECLSGALYWHDFMALAQKAGFADPRLVEDRPLGIENPEVEARIGHIGFYSATYRLFKTPDLEAGSEDYGLSVVYLGSVPNHGCTLAFDKQYRFPKGQPVAVCGNTWRMLKASRFAPHFEFLGDFTEHKGVFECCGNGLPFDRHAAMSAGCC